MHAIKKKFMEVTHPLMVLLGLGASSPLSLGRNQNRRSIINKMASLWNSIKLWFRGFSWSSRPISDSSVEALLGSSIRYSGIGLDEPLIEVWKLFLSSAITSKLFLSKMASLWNLIKLWFRGFSWSSIPVSVLQWKLYQDLSLDVQVD